MSFKNWWHSLDNTSQWIVKVFGALVAGGIVVSMIQCGA